MPQRPFSLFYGNSLRVKGAGAFEDASLQKQFLKQENQAKEPMANASEAPRLNLRGQHESYKTTPQLWFRRSG